MRREVIVDPWVPAPDDLAPRRDEVHVWRVALDPLSPWVERFEAVLSPVERARAGRYRQARDRARFLVGRGWLRTLLGRYIGDDPGRLEFRYGPQGKPELASPAGVSPLRFNLAHSQDLALLAVAQGRQVGIDLEAIRPMAGADQIITRFFSPRERAAYLSLPEPERLDTFFRAWTRKEAYLKATGMGLAMALDQFDVALAPGAPARLLHVEGRPHEPERWALHDLDPGPGFSATLAVEGSGWRLRCYQTPGPEVAGQC
jgi:4'-phosphopantetheinyl transferase